MNFSRAHMLCYAALPETESFSETVRMVHQHGFHELSLWRNALDQGVAEQGSVQALRAYLNELGLRVSVLEILLQWPEGGDGHIREAEEFRELATVLGSDVVMAVCLQKAFTDQAAAYQRLAEQCRILGEANIKVALEFLPWTAIADLQTARNCIRQIGAPNLGYTLDTWHFARAGQDFKTLEQIPGELIYVVQLSDASDRSAQQAILEETMQSRVLPGEGCNDWPRLRRYLQDHCREAIIGPEVFNAELKQKPLDDALATLASTFEAVTAGA